MLEFGARRSDKEKRDRLAGDGGLVHGILLGVRTVQIATGAARQPSSLDPPG